MFKVLDQRRRGLVGLFALAFDAVGQASVLIPSLVEELDEAYAFFDKSTGLQAICRKGSGRLYALPVHRESGSGLLGEVSDFGHAGLHAISHFRLG